MVQGLWKVLGVFSKVISGGFKVVLGGFGGCFGWF